MKHNARPHSVDEHSSAAAEELTRSLGVSDDQITQQRVPFKIYLRFRNKKFIIISVENLEYWCFLQTNIFD